MLLLKRRTLIFFLTLASSFPALAAETASMTIATGVDPSFSLFYVAKLGGFFQKNGLDVELKTGPSGGAMVPLLISNASNASMVASFAGINNHLTDPNIVAVAQIVRYDRFYGMAAKTDIKTLADLRGKKIGVTLGNASESYLYDALKHFKLNPDDFKSSIVNVEPPEMVAAIERGDIQAFSAWEPWLSRTVLNVPNTKVLVDDIGVVQDVGFIYMNRKWIEANRPIALKFMKAMQDTSDFLAKEPEKTREMVGKFLNIPKNMMDSMAPKTIFTFVLGPEA